MSKIALSGNASGTGTFSIVAPNSNTDRTLTLPDEAGTVLTSASSIPASNVTGLTQGITQADQWRLTTTINNTGTAIITANLERSNSDGAGIIGSGMSESSGVFTFPETGIWFITATGYWIGDGGSSSYNGIIIQTTLDGGSNWDSAAGVYTYLENANYQNTRTSFIFDVTNTATRKVRFSRNSQIGSNVDLIGSTSSNGTAFEFIRLGDT